MPDVTFTDALLTLGAEHSRPGTPLHPQGIVLHATADNGATARNIRDYFDRPKPPGERASAHIAVDWTEALTLIPWQPGHTEVAWHAGPTANARYLGMELCQSTIPTQAHAAYQRWVDAAAAICRAYGWAPEDRATVWSHAETSAEWHETDHTDPIGYLQGLGISWEQVLWDIRAAMTPVPTLGTLIRGPAGCTLAQAQQWWDARCAQGYEDIPERVWSAVGGYGVRPDFTLAQVAHETGFAHFGGDVRADQNNFAGLGATGGGVAGASFPGRDTGILAVVQHEYAYATTEPLPGGYCVDPRFGFVRRGTAPYVEWLGHADNPNGTGWAWPGNGYGAAILALMREMAATVVPARAPAPTLAPEATPHAAPAPTPTPDVAQALKDVATADNALADARKALGA